MLKRKLTAAVLAAALAIGGLTGVGAVAALDQDATEVVEEAGRRRHRSAARQQTNSCYCGSNGGTWS